MSRSPLGHVAHNADVSNRWGRRLNDKDFREIKQHLLDLDVKDRAEKSHANILAQAIFDIIMNALAGRFQEEALTKEIPVQIIAESTFGAAETTMNDVNMSDGTSEETATDGPGSGQEPPPSNGCDFQQNQGTTMSSGLSSLLRCLHL